MKASYDELIKGNAGREIKLLQSEVERLTLALQMKNRPDHELHEQRRFEVAKSAMMGIISGPNRLSVAYDRTAILAIEYADALLKAMEEKG